MIRVCLVIMFALAALPLRAATEIKEVVSPGGITAWLVEEPSIPIIALRISFTGGSVLDPAGREGASNLMTSLLDEGSGDLDSRAFAKAVETQSVRIGFDVGPDRLAVSAQMLVDNRDASLALLRDALLSPRFDPVDMERVRAQILSGIRSNATDPDAIAGRTFRELAFPNDPYGRPLDGTEESLSSVTRDDLLAMQKALIVKSRAKIGVVGAITAEELGPMLDALLGDLPDTGPELPAPTEHALTGGVTVVDFKTPQSVVVFAQSGIDRHDPDFFTAYLMNHILGGGGFSSRLTTEVREKRGLTYGVYSYFNGLKRADLWQGGVSSGNDRIAEAIDVIRAEWNKLGENGVTEAELAAAKQYLTGAYPLRFDSNSKIARILVGVQEEDLGIDYIERRNGLVNAVTVEDIARVAKRLVKSDELRFVVVGQPKGLTASN